jgi:hypothetical protein
MLNSRSKSVGEKEMRHWNVSCIVAGLLALCSTAPASTFTFNTDPFAGTPVLSVPGRQVVGGELFIDFNIATDVFSLDSSVFRVGDNVRFANDPVSAVPANPNVVVLETFDNDNNLGTPFGAPQAADLIASRVTNPGPGILHLLQPESEPGPLGIFHRPEQHRLGPEDPCSHVEPLWR